MPYIPTVDTSIPLSGTDPLVAQQRGVALAEQQLGLRQQQQQYQEQQALRSLAQRSDFSTPEGQADYMRQVQRIDPMLAMQMQQAGLKGQLAQAEIGQKQAQAEQERKAGALKEAQMKDELRDSAQKEALTQTSVAWQQYQSDQRQYPPSVAEKRFRDALKSEKDNLTQKYGDAAGFLANFNPDTFQVAQVPQFLQALQQKQQQQVQPGKTRNIIQGDKEIQQEWTGTEWKNIGEGPRWNPKPTVNAIVASGLSDEAVEQAATEYRETGKMPPAITRSPTAVMKILDRAAAQNKEAGVGGAEASTNRQANLADSKSLANITKQTDMIQSFENTALKNLDMLVAESDKIPRSQWPLLNKAILKGKLETGDPESAKLFAIVKPFVDEYAKILSGQTGAAGASDTARREAAEIISPYFSQEQIRQLKPFITQELNNRTNSLHGQINDIQQRMKDRVSGGKKEEKPKFEEGKVYVDAKGRKAKYQNGQWVSAE